MSVPIIGRDVEPKLDWIALTRAIKAGHALPRAEIGDTFLWRGPDTLLSRAAWVDGMGAVVKTATVFPGNVEAGLPSIGGTVSLFSDADGALEAILDFHLVTKWKTAGDSLLGALRLAPPKVETILIVGAGTVGHSLRAAYGAGFPGAVFEVWNRTGDRARAFADSHPNIRAVSDLAGAVARADIVTCATMSGEPVIRGNWLRPGQHLDLIGAYRADMREADDAALQRGRVFVDSFATTLDHIGELKIPLASGAISRNAVLADFYDLDRFQRGPEDITVFKNGGGAHLDLMTARYILGVA